jgi:hypothetical protein
MYGYEGTLFEYTYVCFYVQGILLQQKDVTVSPDREYMLCVRSAMANAERVMSLFVERQEGGAGISGGRLIAQKSVQMSPGVLQVPF